MKELVEFVACSLVDDPTQVKVEEVNSSGKIHIELQVSKDDMGRIIGKSGRVANSLRLLLRVAAARQGKQVTLDVIEPK